MQSIKWQGKSGDQKVVICVTVLHTRLSDKQN